MADRRLPPHLKRRLLSGGAWTLGGRAVAALTVLASNALLARLLSPPDLGVYFLAYSVIGVGWVLGTLGLNQPVVRFVAESMGVNRPERARRVVGLVLGLGVAGALVAGLLYLFFGDLLAERLFHAPALASVTGLVAGWIVVASLQGLLADTFRGFHDFRSATIFGNFNGLLTGVLLVSFLALLWLLDVQAMLTTIMLLSISSSGASALLAGWVLRRKVKSLPLRGTEGQIKIGAILRVAWPLLITNLTLFTFIQADLWIVGALRPPEEVAIYGAASRMVQLVAMPLVIAAATVMPLVAEMYAQGKKEELERMLRIIATLNVIPAFLLVVGFIFLGGPMLGLVFGDYYRAAAPLLVLLSIGVFAQVWAGCCEAVLTMTDHQVSMMVVTVISGTVKILAGIWGAIHYGAPGVAAAACASFVIQSISMMLVTRYKTGIWTHLSLRSLPKIVSATRETIIRLRTRDRMGGE